MKIIIFGAGICGRKMYSYIADNTIINLCRDNDIVVTAVADNNKTQDMVEDAPLISADEIFNYEFDYIVIAIDVDSYSTIGIDNAKQIYYQLLNMGIEQNKIVLQSMVEGYKRQRVEFLEKLVPFLSTEGSLAECGVFRGQFAGYINAFFPDHKLYLFDTFEGFQENDAIKEDAQTQQRISEHWNPYFSKGDELISLLRCPARENITVKRGCVPETFAGLENERFAFVNLDMDLYAPMLSALEFFYPRMIKGGVILCHDYYFEPSPGVSRAVNEYRIQENATVIPINDEYSVAFIK